MIRAMAALALIVMSVLSARFRRFVVAERSMSPSLRPGDYLVSVRSKHCEIGQMVIFAPPNDPNFYLVKRVVAVAGSRVRLEMGIITIDGTVQPEPWAHGRGGDGEWHLANNEVLVLGDDRALSSGDSVAIGPLPISLIDSVVRFRYWPLGRIGPL